MSDGIQTKEEIALMKKWLVGASIYEKGSEKNVALTAYMDDHKIDCWVLCDGPNMKNSVAHAMLATKQGISGGVVGRAPCFGFIHPNKQPILLVAELEKKQAKFFEELGGKVEVYSDREGEETFLKKHLQGYKKIAIEYSPKELRPSVSYVTAGTKEFLEKQGKKLFKRLKIVSSAEMIQYSAGLLSDKLYEQHLKAGEQLIEIYKEAWRFMKEEIKKNKKVGELAVTEFIIKQYEDRGMSYEEEGAAIIAITKNACAPHYFAKPKDEKSDEISSWITEGDLVLMDICAKMDNPDGVYADFTWMIYVGEKVPKDSRYEHDFDVVSGGRNAAVKEAKKIAKRDVKGCEVDQAARTYMEHHKKGLPKNTSARCIHEVGHALGKDIHGFALGPANYKYREERILVPKILFTIEPGLYFEDTEDKENSFGMRSEINVFMKKEGEEVFPVVTKPYQTKVVPILADESVWEKCWSFDEM